MEPKTTLFLMSVPVVLAWQGKPQAQIVAVPDSTVKVSVPAKPSVHTSKPLRVSKVPLAVGKHRLYIWATFGKQKQKCVLDTGGYRCLWPRRLGLPHTPEMFKASITDAGGKSLTGEGKILKQVQIGTYFLDELPSFAHASHRKADLLSMPVLGNEAFEETILTIDCRNGQLEIRQPGSSLSASPYSHGATLLKFARVPNRRQVYPCVAAVIEHKRVHMLLDTGWTHDEIGITPRLCSDLHSVLHTKHSRSVIKNLSFLTGNSTTRGFQTIEWSLGKVQRSGTAFVVPYLHPGVDAVCGLSVFLSNRVSIDYPHREVLLEPYEQTSVR